MRTRTETRRAAIIETAAKLFREVGYERASLDEVVKRLGGSKATLYGYFPSKEALFAAVIRASATTHLSEATAELQACRDRHESLECTLLRFAERVLYVLTDDADAIAVVRMVIAEAGRSDVGQAFLDAGPRECLTALGDVMRRAMETGELRKADPDILAGYLLALVTSEIDARLYQRDPPTLAMPAIRQIAARAVEMFLMGASPREKHV